MKLNNLNRSTTYGIVIGVLIVLCTFLNTSLPVSALNFQEEKPNLTYGLELDILPFLTDGYYFSSWTGLDHYRVRGVVSEVNVPEFALPDDFEDWNIKAYALIIDYFPRNNFEGPWVGAGFERWKSKITSEKSEESSALFQNVLTLGGGYVYKFNDNFYSNVWAAGHYITNGRHIMIENDNLEIPTFQSEVSLKFGWKW